MDSTVVEHLLHILRALSSIHRGYPERIWGEDLRGEKRPAGHRVRSKESGLIPGEITRDRLGQIILKIPILGDFFPGASGSLQMNMNEYVYIYTRGLLGTLRVGKARQSMGAHACKCMDAHAQVHLGVSFTSLVSIAPDLDPITIQDFGESIFSSLQLQVPENKNVTYLH